MSGLQLVDIQRRDVDPRGAELLLLRLTEGRWVTADGHELGARLLLLRRVDGEEVSP